jgi:tetratricopeptide (TPR) repeat protein
VTAIVSGREGTALVWNGMELFSIHADDPTRRIPRQAGDLPHILPSLLEGRGDLRFIETEDADEIARELAADAALDDALRMVAIALSVDYTNPTRVLALEALDEQLEDESLSSALENILHGGIVPESADLVGAVKLVAAEVAPRAISLFGTLGSRRAFIHRAVEVWQASFAGVRDKTKRHRLHQLGVTSGMFRGVATALQERSAPRSIVDAALLQAPLDRALSPSERVSFLSWATSLQPTEQPGQLLASSEDREATREPDVLSRRASQSRDRLTLEEILQSVDARKAFILKAMRHGRWTRVGQALDDLEEFQRTYGGTEHLVKSLCALASDAKALGHPELQLDLARRAVRVHPTDAWARNQLADALLEQGDPEKALETYLKVQEDYPENAVAKKGAAEVLKALGRLPEALDAYQAAQRAHPEDVVAKCGLAGVLKAMGRLPEALDCYQAAQQAHPENVVAKCGLAEVLKAMGRLPEALDIYQATQRAHPEDVVPKNGLAEVLKAMGRLPEALDAYQATQRAHPEDVVAKNGLAEVLKAMGRLPEALDAYQAAQRAHPEDVIAECGLAEVLKTMGRLPEAFDAYQAAQRAHPEDVVVKCGLAEVLKSMGRLPEALDAYEVIRQAHPENAVARNGLASVLVGMKRYREALEALPGTLPSSADDWVSFHIRAMISLRAGNVEESSELLSYGASRCPFAIQRAYFKVAFSIALLHRQRFEDAQSVLAEVETPALELPKRVLNTHALGASGKRAEAEQVVQSLERELGVKPTELIAELRTRFVLGRPGHGDGWLLEQESDMLLRVA